MQTLTKNLNFELQVEFEICKLVQLHKQAQDRHEPWIRRLESPRARAVLQYLADEGNCDNKTTRLVTLQQQILESQIAVQNGTLLCQCSKT